jgi:hypothetical protein
MSVPQTLAQLSAPWNYNTKANTNHWRKASAKITRPRQANAQIAQTLAFKTFHDFLDILRLHSHFFQSCAKMLKEQVKMHILQTVISGAGMSVMNILPCMHSSAEEHGNEHGLPGPEVHHVNSLKELAQAIILQDLVVEEFSSILDSATSPDHV